MIPCRNHNALSTMDHQEEDSRQGFLRDGRKVSRYDAKRMKFVDNMDLHDRNSCDFNILMLAIVDIHPVNDLHRSSC
jgi:hypothetical protein